MQIKWSDDAINRVNDIVAYYESEGFIQAADNFRLTLVETVNKIVKMPSVGMPSMLIDGIHSRHIDSNRRVFYEFD